MYKVECKKKALGITPFKWGCYYHFRWNLKWLHFKWGVWRQHGLRISTRKQLKFGRKSRYVTAYRFQISIWSSNNGKEGKPMIFGCMFYGGKNNGVTG